MKETQNIGLIYHDPFMSHDEVVTLLHSQNETDIGTALISIGLYEPDGAWAQQICLHYMSNSKEHLMAPAITALGHLARRFGELEMDKVLPALHDAGEKYPSLNGTISDAMDDIEMFI